VVVEAPAGVSVSVGQSACSGPGASCATVAGEALELDVMIAAGGSLEVVISSDVEASQPYMVSIQDDRCDQWREPCSPFYGSCGRARCAQAPACRGVGSCDDPVPIIPESMGPTLFREIGVLNDHRNEPLGCAGSLGNGFKRMFAFYPTQPGRYCFRNAWVADGGPRSERIGSGFGTSCATFGSTCGTPTSIFTRPINISSEQVEAASMGQPLIFAIGSDIGGPHRYELRVGAADVSCEDVL
jgi:hypothetical protein